MVLPHQLFKSKTDKQKTSNFFASQWRAQSKPHQSAPLHPLQDFKALYKYCIITIIIIIILTTVTEEVHTIFCISLTYSDPLWTLKKYPPR